MLGLGVGVVVFLGEWAHIDHSLQTITAKYQDRDLGSGCGVTYVQLSLKVNQEVADETGPSAVGSKS